MKSPQLSSETIYFRGLDGIRAIAAVAVLLSHTLLYLPEFGVTQQAGGGLLLAGFGVSIFFALSGFLITYLLLKEGIADFSIKNFYIRRVLRIWPLYYLYLSIFILTAFVYDLEGLNGTLLFYFILTANIPLIIGTAIPYIGHYWSIGVEEQFYLLWPWVLKKSKTHLIPLILAFIVLSLGAKLILKFTTSEYDANLIYKTIHITRFHCMLIGALGAILYYNGHATFIKICIHWFPQLVAWLIIGLVSLNYFHVASIVDNEIICLITVILIVGQITQTKNTISLDYSILNSLGKISYGVYVIHPLVIFYMSKIIIGLEVTSTQKLIMAFASVTGVTLLLAWLSYRYFERFFLQMKSHYS